LTLQLMGRYLALAYAGDIRKRDTFEFTEADDEVQGGHAFRVLKAYETWLSASGEAGRRQLAILRLLGLFDRPADPGCLAALRQPPVIDGLTEEVANLSDAQWNIAVKRLEEIGLVTQVAYEARKAFGYSEEQAKRGPRGLPEPEEFHPIVRIAHNASSLEAHPLLREHFGRQLRSAASAGWQAGHRRLFEHLQRSVPYWPEGVEALGPLYQAVAHGCQAGVEEQALQAIYLARILRGAKSGMGAYSLTRLGTIGADLGALTCFFTQPWLTVTPNLLPLSQASVFGMAGYSLRALGRLTEAVEPMRTAMEKCIALGELLGAAAQATNLSELKLTLGEISEAVLEGKQSVLFADRSKDGFRRMGNRSTYADSLHQAGRREEALRWFCEAEKVQAKRDPMYPRLYSFHGFLYCDFLLADAERTAWQVTMNQVSQLSPSPRPTSIPARKEDPSRTLRSAEKRAREMLAWDSPFARLLDIGLHHLTLGRAALYRALLHATSTLPPANDLDAAVAGLRQAGAMHHLPRGLLTRAWLRCLHNDEAGCRTDLDETWEIAEPGPMRLHMADILLTRARLFRDRDALAQARTLIEQCGYGRRLPELADAETALA